MVPQRICACLVLVACGAGLGWLSAAEPSRSTLVAQTGPPSPKKKDDKVKAEAHLSVDKLPPGGECQVLIRLTIESGWHINTNPANPEEFIPTEVAITGKLGTKSAGIKYPKGKELQMKGFDDPVWVYDGKLDVRGKLIVPAAAAGKSEDVDIVVKYQACNDKICLPPATVTLKGKLPVAASAGDVKPINAKLFPPESP